MSTIGDNPEERKRIPMARGLLDYFPAALAEVAKVSLVANEQHNPGEEMHHARGKSTDHADCIIRHLVDRGRTDSDGLRHSAKVAWRALALLQEELEEEEGAPFPRAAKLPPAKPQGPYTPPYRPDPDGGYTPLKPRPKRPRPTY